MTTVELTGEDFFSSFLSFFSFSWPGSTAQVTSAHVRFHDDTRMVVSEVDLLNFITLIYGAGAVGMGVQGGTA